MKKQMLMLSAAVLVGGLLAGGLPLQAAETPTPRVEIKPASPKAKVPPRRRDRTDFLARYLKLTDEQKEKMRPVFAKEAEKVNAMRKNRSMTVEERRNKYRAIREETNAALKKIMTDEQWEKYSHRGQRSVVRPPGARPPVRPAK